MLGRVDRRVGVSSTARVCTCTRERWRSGSYSGKRSAASARDASARDCARIHRNWCPRALLRALYMRSRTLGCGGDLDVGRTYVGVMMTMRFASPAGR